MLPVTGRSPASAQCSSACPDRSEAPAGAPSLPLDLLWVYDRPSPDTRSRVTDFYGHTSRQWTAKKQDCCACGWRLSWLRIKTCCSWFVLPCLTHHWSVSMLFFDVKRPLTSTISLISLCDSSLSSFTRAVPIGLSLRKKPLWDDTRQQRHRNSLNTVTHNLFSITLTWTQLWSDKANLWLSLPFQ